MRRWPRGLTLLELAIALATAVLLAALALPSFTDWLSRQRLRATAQQLATDLGEARQESARLARTVYVTFRQGATWCYAIAVSTYADCRHPDAMVLKVVRGSDHPGVRLTAAATQTFDPVGTVADAAGSVDFAVNSGDALSVRMTRLGRPSVCSASPALSDLGPC